jgi:hypothetical protein
MNQPNFAEAYSILFQYAVDPQDPFGLNTASISMPIIATSPKTQTKDYQPGQVEYLLLSAISVVISGYMTWRIYRQTRELIPIVNYYIGNAYDNKEQFFKNFLNAVSE